MRNTEPSLTNIFEKALFERYLSLEIGAPDEKILDVIRKAGDEITKEVKILLNKEYELRQIKKREARRELFEA